MNNILPWHSCRKKMARFLEEKKLAGFNIQRNSLKSYFIKWKELLLGEQLIKANVANDKVNYSNTEVLAQMPQASNWNLQLDARTQVDEPLSHSTEKYLHAIGAATPEF